MASSPTHLANRLPLPIAGRNWMLPLADGTAGPWLPPSTPGMSSAPSPLSPGFRSPSRAATLADYERQRQSWQPSSSDRLYCPVPGCPSSDPTRAPGWTSKTTLISHVDSHLAGTLQGHVPAQWFLDHRRQRCTACGLSVSTRHGAHPTCQPSVRAALGAGAAARLAADAAGLPSLDDIQARQIRTLRHIPVAARYLWGQVLIRALAATAHHNDLKAWTELLMLPQSVLGAPPRAGRRHRRAAAAYTVDRLRRWSEGERRSLWDDTPRTPAAASRKPLSEEQRRELAVGLAHEGFDRKACNVLLQTGLCAESAAITAALRALHPAQLPPRVDLASLPLADELSEEVVARALRNFPADTAPSPSGLRVQYLREAGPPGTTSTACPSSGAASPASWLGFLALGGRALGRSRGTSFAEFPGRHSTRPLWPPGPTPSWSRAAWHHQRLGRTPHPAAEA